MDVIAFFQQAMSHVPVIVQPFLVALAGVIPFVEGELAAVLGVWAGLNPFVAAIAAAAGNFASVFVVVFFGARIRAAVVARRARKAAAARVAVVPVAAGGVVSEAAEPELGSERELEPAPAPVPVPVPAKPESKGVQRFKRFLVRFGVPGASILGPLALPTQFTSAVLVSTGVAKGWILLWQGVAIVLWTTVTTLSAVGVLALLEG